MRQDAPQGTAVRPMAKARGGRLASLPSFLESFSFLRPHSIHISLAFSLPLPQFPLSSNLPLHLSVSSFLHFPFGLSPCSLLHLSLCFTITFYINLPFFTFILLGSRSLSLSFVTTSLSSSLFPPPCLSFAFPSPIFFPSLHLPLHLFIFLIRHSPLLLTLFPSVLSPPLRLPLPSFPPPGDRFRPGRTLLRLRPLPREPWPASELIGRPLALHVPLPLLGFYSVFYQHFIFLRWGRRRFGLWLNQGLFAYCICI